MQIVEHFGGDWTSVQVDHQQSDRVIAPAGAEDSLQGGGHHQDKGDGEDKQHRQSAPVAQQHLEFFKGNGKYLIDHRSFSFFYSRSLFPVRFRKTVSRLASWISREVTWAVSSWVIWSTWISAF